MSRTQAYTLYSSVERQKIQWLWYPYIPYGKLTLLQGDPGDGKSTFMIHIAAGITKGIALPDGGTLEEPGTVIYQCAEDNVSDTIKPRLEAAGADCSKIAFIDDSDHNLTFTDDRLEETIRAFRAKLLILDPLQAFIPTNTDMQNASHVRSTLRKLSAVAERNQCAVVIIGHMTKAGNGKSLYRGLGSIDIAAICRSVLMITRDDKNPGIRYMFQVKSNLAPEGEAVGFVLDPELGFHWIGRCLAEQNGEQKLHSRKMGKKEQASMYLRVMLSAGDVPSAEVLNKLDELGIKERTVRKAAKEIGIKSYRKKGIWYWNLPDSEEEVTEE